MKEDNYLEESIKKCVDHTMLQDDDGKRRILTGLFEWNDKLINEQLVVQALKDEDKKQWFVDEMIIAAQKETEELQQRIDKAIEYIEKSKLNPLNTYCKYLYVDYDTGEIEHLDELLEILKGSDKE